MPNSLVIASNEDPEVLVVKLNRPEKRNALNIDLMNEFCAVMENVKQQPSIRVIIVHGEGAVFCAGLDLQEATNAEVEEDSALLFQKTLLSISTAPQVTIGAVHGAAIAGGAGLMAAFDFVIASPELMCGFPEVHRGLVAAQVAVILKRELARHHLRELLLLGELISAERAHEIGLVYQIVSKADLLSEAYRLAQKVLLGAPEAIRATKRLLHELDPLQLEQAFIKALPYHHQARHSQEALEGINAFIEKRKPVW